ncbi:PTS glucose transporter subunit IIA [Clostridium saccharobutylicum]|uniref:PTS glucose transporter subunit IIA n=1 Tax=Clostridium saccharobutylicum TaxID=169679 RepID=UPI001F4BE6C4|nr:PTS glucose transporter subunit IIA [Clostridium saccharobutylicum]
MFGFFKKKKTRETTNNSTNTTFKLVSSYLWKINCHYLRFQILYSLKKMAGDGIAINPTGDVAVAPADGELTLVFNTKHAFALTLENGGRTSSSTWS